MKINDRNKGNILINFFISTILIESRNDLQKMMEEKKKNSRIQS